MVVECDLLFEFLVCDGCVAPGHRIGGPWSSRLHNAAKQALIVGGIRIIYNSHVINIIAVIGNEGVAVR